MQLIMKRHPSRRQTNAIVDNQATAAGTAAKKGMARFSILRNHLILSRTLIISLLLVTWCYSRAGTMLKAISIAAVAASAAAETFIPASDPRIWYAGRTQINADGSRSFDWEATSFYINTVKSSYVKVRTAAVGASTSE